MYFTADIEYIPQYKDHQIDIPTPMPDDQFFISVSTSTALFPSGKGIKRGISVG
jgi:hypothetical protein